MMESDLPPSIQRNAQPTAPYSLRPPSPPFIYVPAVTHHHHHHQPPSSPNNKPNSNNLNNPDSSQSQTRAQPLMTITPSPLAIHTLPGPPHLTEEELWLITGKGKPQTASDPAANAWVYESRRRAQAVLDFLMLGPASVLKDKEFLAREGVSMVLDARDAARFGGAMGRVRGELVGLGVEVRTLLGDGDERASEGGGGGGVGQGPNKGLVAVFDGAAGKVNGHLLEVVRQSGGSSRPGKVLVVCETGNDRSAAVVAAYLMAVYGLDTVQAVQFLQLKRFCVVMGDEVKYMLQAYGDILKARADVARMGGSGGNKGMPRAAVAAQGQGQGKRRIEETRGGGGMDGEDDGDTWMMGEMDGERYAGRNNFVPFVEHDYSGLNL